MNYHLKAESISTYKKTTERNMFELVYRVKELNKELQNPVVYDKQLKMHFENPNATNIHTYEIDVQFVKLDLCQRLSKGAELHRKLFYRYDWLKITQSGNGSSLTVLNKNELDKRWKKLRKYITDSGYRGNSLEEYLEKIDKEFDKSLKIYPSMNQYLYFALFFPQIYENYIENRNTKRIIEFSPFENEKFVESVTSKSLTDGIIQYEVTGNTLPESKTDIKEYTGEITKPIGEILPTHVNINTSIEMNNINSQWNFQLTRV